MFSEFFALICTLVTFITANPVEDILLTLSFCAVIVVFSAVMLMRAVRRRAGNKSKQ